MKDSSTVCRLSERWLSRRRGVSLVEMLVVLAIIGMLTGLGFYMFQVARNSADRIAADAEAVIAKLERKPSPPQRGTAPTPIPNQHVFVFQDNVADVEAETQRLATVASFKTLHVYDQGAFKGFAANASPENHAILRKDAAIQGTEQDQRVSIRGQQVPRGVQRSMVNLSYSGISPGVPIPSRKLELQQSHQPIWSNVNVAVMDTGIDASHPELNVVFSRGFVGGKAKDVADLHGHGTHVAGTIGAFNNSLGVVGVAPGVRLYNLKILDADGSGSFSDMIAALGYVQAHADEIHVVNMSVGGPFSPLINKAVNRCVQAGVVVVVAAGNDGKPTAGFSPASAAKAIAVGACADADGKAGGKGGNTGAGMDDTFATFSNYGPQVKVLAPGVKIASTFPIKKGGYAVMSGTSMATPHVAGLAARIQHIAMSPTAPGASLYFRGRAAGVRATPAEILNVLMQNATEKIPGRFDALQYPLLSAKGL